MAVTRIVVVGGVAGGMSAAARARRIDEHAEIIVLERGPEVSFANCGLPYFVSGEIKDPDALLIHTPTSLRETLNLDVRTGHEAIALDGTAQRLTVRSTDGDYALSYDALVLSPGAEAIRPPLPGLDSPRLHTLRTVADARALHALATSGAKQAVVLGAGFIGLEAAEALHNQGLDVAVVELAPHVLPPLEPEVAHHVRAELLRLGLTVHDGVGAERIEVGDTNDVVVLADGTRVDADLVVLSVGVRPRTQPFANAGLALENGAIVVDEHGRTSLPNVWAVGDAVLSVDAVTGVRRPVALAGPANRAGRLVADNILTGAGRPIPAPLGTAIVRVGEVTAAMTGANRRTLSEQGLDFHTIDLHALNHAGYFPGAEQIHLMVHFSAEDGRLLGAQAAGKAGVDKRIDVLATALRAGMTVDDLIDLDLAYSPPYGSAKDPVNIAGYKGQNVLTETIKLWSSRELEEVARTALILDVRSEAEYTSGHIDGALNVPHTQVRGQLQVIREAAAGRPVRVLCASGMRSYLAHRILDQSGFDSATLSGGLRTLNSSQN